MNEIITWISVIIGILLILVNAFYNYLPKKYRRSGWIRLIAMVAAIILAGKGSCELINKEINRIEAIVSWDGSLLKAKNFPWEMKKYEKNTKETTFLISERYGDASQVKVIIDKEYQKPIIYNSADGIAIRFLLSSKNPDTFKVIIAN